jgi:hypothetical protein
MSWPFFPHAVFFTSFAASFYFMLEFALRLQEGSMSPGLYSDSDECGSEDEEVTDDDESYVDDATEESDVYTDADNDNASSGTCTQSGDSCEDDPSDHEVHPLDFLTCFFIQSDDLV